MQSGLFGGIDLVVALFLLRKKEIKCELYRKMMLVLVGYSVLQAVLCSFPTGLTGH